MVFYFILQETRVTEVVVVVSVRTTKAHMVADQ